MLNTPIITSPHRTPRMIVGRRRPDSYVLRGATQTWPDTYSVLRVFCILCGHLTLYCVSILCQHLLFSPKKVVNNEAKSEWPPRCWTARGGRREGDGRPRRCRVIKFSCAPVKNDWGGRARGEVVAVGRPTPHSFGRPACRTYRMIPHWVWGFQPWRFRPRWDSRRAPPSSSIPCIRTMPPPRRHRDGRHCAAPRVLDVVATITITTAITWDSRSDAEE